MSVEQTELRTRRGDDVLVSLFTHADEEPTILVSVTDPDDSPLPTAEFTIGEAAMFRDVLRRYCETGSKASRVGG